MGAVFGAQLSESQGPVAAVIPQAGFSMWDAAGRTFEQPEARQAFVDGLRGSGPDVPVTEVAAHINDPQFAEAVFSELMTLIEPAEKVER